MTSTAWQTETETASARGRIFTLLAEVFRAAPGAEMISSLRRSDIRAVLDELGLSLGADFNKAPLPKLEESLALEYTRLFVGPGPHLSPNASIHVRKEGRSGAQFWGPETAQVKAFMEEAGLAVADDFAGMPDHISAEFEFIARLADHEADLWAAGRPDVAARCRDIQVRFLNEHIAPWVPLFCEKLGRNTEHPFYRGIAELTAAVVAFENGNTDPGPIPDSPGAPGAECAAR